MALTVDFGNPVAANLVPYHRVRKQQLAMPLQQGAVGAGDMKVTQRAAGANMSVDIAPGDAWIRTIADTPDGLAHVYNDSVANLAVATSHATLPRIDQIVAQYNDTTLPAGVGGDTPTLNYYAGTATSGATIDNRTGAAISVPANGFLLADILVPAASSSVTTANIRDRRPWARGAFFAGRYTGGNITTSTISTFLSINAAALSPRLEISAPLVELSVWFEWVGGASASIMTSKIAWTGSPGNGQSAQADATGAAGETGLIFLRDCVSMGAGSYLFDPQYSSTLATNVIRANATNPVTVMIREVITPSATN